MLRVVFIWQTIPRPGTAPLLRRSRWRSSVRSIRRVDRNRAVNVTASVDTTVTSAGDVIADLNARILHEVLARHPGVFYTFEGNDGGAAGRARRPATGLRAGAADDLRAAGGAAPVLRGAAHHHERHSVRPHRGGLGAHLPGPRRVDNVDVRARRGDRRRGQRQPDHGRLHRPAGAPSLLRRAGAAHPARPRRHPRHGPLSARRALARRPREHAHPHPRRRRGALQLRRRGRGRDAASLPSAASTATAPSTSPPRSMRP